MTMAAALFLVLSCLMGVESSYLLSHPDKITQLPGQPPVQFQHFSGYVTVDEKKEKALFYYLLRQKLTHFQNLWSCG
ncbi:UNVERIFIED_CONTAM: Serine carboxypeptidase-like 46 [Sesamum latifolium]|uniref:Serine carboxypeptidase-like 46 n=1 Tax=Sesamum latifolium TaxID=2727402 RepID=A0AAW2UG48_9LAMI